MAAHLLAACFMLALKTLGFRSSRLISEGDRRARIFEKRSQSKIVPSDVQQATCCMAPSSTVRRGGDVWWYVYVKKSENAAESDT